jgi:hypothetical protein
LHFFLPDNGMRLARLELTVKETINAFKGHILCLWDQEIDEDEATDHQRCEEEVDTIAHSCEHLRRESSYEEVPEPVVGCSGALRECTDVGVEHFAIIDPWCRIPCWSIEGLEGSASVNEVGD